MSLYDLSHASVDLRELKYANSR